MNWTVCMCMPKCACLFHFNYYYGYAAEVFSVTFNLMLVLPNVLYLAKMLKIFISESFNLSLSTLSLCPVLQIWGIAIVIIIIIILISVSSGWFHIGLSYGWWFLIFLMTGNLWFGARYCEFSLSECEFCVPINIIDFFVCCWNQLSCLETVWFILCLSCF